MTQPAPPPYPAALDQVVVVLVEPQLAVNIGTVIRAMKNMGLLHLRLVNPSPDVDLARTQISAHRSMDVVERITRHDDLEAAVADCHHLVGLTARIRSGPWSQQTPRVRAPDLVGRARQGQRVALLFGRESSGLTNDELDRCDALLTIPTRLDYASLNLAQAVLLTSYELLQAARETPFNEAVLDAPAPPPAPAHARHRLIAQVEHALGAIGFFKSGSATPVMRSLRQIISRADPDAHETRLLTGVFVEVLKFAHLVRRGVIPADLPPATVQLSDPDAPDEA